MPDPIARLLRLTPYAVPDTPPGCADCAQDDLRQELASLAWKQQAARRKAKRDLTRAPGRSGTARRAETRPCGR